MIPQSLKTAGLLANDIEQSLSNAIDTVTVATSSDTAQQITSAVSTNGTYLSRIDLSVRGEAGERYEVG